MAQKRLGRKKAAWRIDKEDLARAEKTPYPSEYPRAVTCTKIHDLKKKKKATLCTMTLATWTCITKIRETMFTRYVQ